MVVLSDLTKYGPIYAKVSVLRRGLLTKRDYEELIAKKNVAEVAAYLKNETAYGECLSGMSEQDVHREELERRMNGALVGDVIKIYRFDKIDNKKFYSYVYLKSEIEMIKTILRRLANDEPDLQWIAGIPEFFKKHFTTDPDQLAQSKNLRDFLENLAGSRYEPVIAPILKLSEHQNLASVEMTLDMYYYSQTWKLIESLDDKEDREIMRRTVGGEIEMLNLLWIYRCKKYFHMESELIYSLLIPNPNKRLTTQMIKQIVESKDLEEFRRLVSETPYREEFNWGAEAFYDQCYWDYVYRMHRKMAKENPYSIESAVSYFHLKELEIKNITSITEGIRYGLSPDEIKRYLVGAEL